VVRITGSDDDESITRDYCIYNGDDWGDGPVAGFNYRSFRGFAMDGAWVNITLCAASNVVVEDCVFADYPSLSLIEDYGITDTPCSNVTMRRCLSSMAAGQTALYIGYQQTLGGTVIVENCVVTGGSGIAYVYNGFNVTINACTILGTFFGVVHHCDPSSGAAIAVTNSVFAGSLSTAFTTLLLVTGLILEDYNTLWANNNDRAGVTTGAHSDGLLPGLRSMSLVSGYKLPHDFFSVLPWSSLGQVLGTHSPGHDFYGILRPTTASKVSRGAVQYQPVVRNTAIKRTGASSLELTDAGRTQMFVPTTNTSTTISVYVYRGPDYTGVLPQLIIKQPGQPDRTTLDTGNVETWNLLTDTFTPAAVPSYVVVELVSENSAAAGATVYALFDDLVVS
jgi:hypothetical protein